jgi:hypothetical protein
MRHVITTWIPSGILQVEQATRFANIQLSRFQKSQYQSHEQKGHSNNFMIAGQSLDETDRYFGKS